VTVGLLALRERARRWLRIQAVKLGVSCIHAIDAKAWRPAACRAGMEINCEDVVIHQNPSPARVCRYCDRIEYLIEADYYAQFGHDFRARVGA
jgi:hypothetical protein